MSTPLPRPHTPVAGSGHMGAGRRQGLPGRSLQSLIYEAVWEPGQICKSQTIKRRAPALSPASWAPGLPCLACAQAASWPPLVGPWGPEYPLKRRIRYGVRESGQGSSLDSGPKCLKTPPQHSGWKATTCRGPLYLGVKRGVEGRETATAVPTSLMPSK